MTRVMAFLQPGMADWEAGPVLAGLREHLDAEVRTASPDGAPVVTIGGLKVTPNLSYGDVGPDDADAFLVIGSDQWPVFRDEDFLTTLREAAAGGKIVAGICGGVVPLARAGVLEGRAHTSNGRDWLQSHAPGYGGSDRYQDTPAAVTDGCVVTASGLAPITFAAAVFRLAAPEQPLAERYQAMFARELQGLEPTL